MQNERRVVKHKTIFAGCPDDLDREVDEALAAGWHLYGDLVAVSTGDSGCPCIGYIREMVKYATWP